MCCAISLVSERRGSVLLRCEEERFLPLLEVVLRSLLLLPPPAAEACLAEFDTSTSLSKSVVSVSTARRDDEWARVGEVGGLRSRGVAEAVAGVDCTLTSSSSVSTCSHSLRPCLASAPLSVEASLLDVPNVALASLELSTFCSRFDIIQCCTSVPE